MNGELIFAQLPRVQRGHGENHLLNQIHHRYAADSVPLLFGHIGNGIVRVIFGNVGKSVVTVSFLVDFRLKLIHFLIGGVERGETVNDGHFADSSRHNDNRQNRGEGDSPVNRLFPDGSEVNGTLDRDMSVSQFPLFYGRPGFIAVSLSGGAVRSL